jgi:ABC-type sugar transport system ATPase subunit
LSLVPDLSVTENVMLGRLPRRRGIFPRRVDWDRARRTTADAFAKLGIPVDPATQVRSLGIASQQFVEIAKAMIYDPAVLLLDEPTSALSRQEAERLFTLLRTLAARGVVLLYITHRLQELPLIADDVTVLRDGEVAGNIPVAEATPEKLAAMMFGRVLRHGRPADLRPGRERVLTARGLSRRPAVQDASFTVFSGEILGIAGLLGSGRTELLRLLCGADQPDGGEVEVRGVTLRPPGPERMKKLGVVLVPEDRNAQGLIQILSTRHNMCLTRPPAASWHGLTSRERERCVVRPLVESLAIAVPDEDAPVFSLSGGNQQKVSVAKWLATNPSVLLLDEPTRGIDVEAKQQIFDIIWDLSRRGIASIVVSSELEELLLLCDRILIMRGGRTGEEVHAAAVTLDRLLALCFA